MEKQTAPRGEYGIIIASWQVPQYEKHERNKTWYVLASLVFIALIAYALIAANFLFAIIIVIGGLILVLNDKNHPIMMDFVITTEGVIIGKKFYDYDEIKDFSIIFKPHYNIKKLYFEFKSGYRPRLSIPLLDINPLPIRENLLKYLPEDLERVDEPLSEALAKFLKI